MMLPHHVRWFESLPLTLKIAAGVKLFHGSPTDDLTYPLDTVEQTGARPYNAARGSGYGTTKVALTPLSRAPLNVPASGRGDLRPWR